MMATTWAGGASSGRRSRHELAWVRTTYSASSVCCGVFGRIKRELRRRSAIEAVIGHMKAEGHLGRCYLRGRAGDAANAVLSAIGYNFRLILAWLRMLLRLLPKMIYADFIVTFTPKWAF